MNLYFCNGSSFQISRGSRPVIVFFHGGNFQTGSSNEWPGHVLSSRGIIVVTVNYRLGAFGFLSFGDANTGNYGLQVFFNASFDTKYATFFTFFLFTLKNRKK